VPETTSFLIMGLGATVVIMGAYLASLLLRHQNLSKDEDLIRQLREDEA
jgi:hypothetical protein